MGKRVLIAEAHEVIRAGLCAVFQHDATVSEVNGAATYEELKKQLSSFDPDLTVVNHALITDMQALPQGKFALLIDKPDIDVLLSAYKHRARGYFSINVSAYLLCATLQATRGSFLVDPILLPWMMEILVEAKKRNNEFLLLSPREREIIILLEEGLDRYNIAQQLHISEATLKTHMKNISHKHEDIHWAKKIQAYRRRMKEF